MTRCVMTRLVILTCFIYVMIQVNGETRGRDNNSNLRDQIYRKVNRETRDGDNNSNPTDQICEKVNGETRGRDNNFNISNLRDQICRKVNGETRSRDNNSNRRDQNCRKDKERIIKVIRGFLGAVIDKSVNPATSATRSRCVSQNLEKKPYINPEPSAFIFEPLDQKPEKNLEVNPTPAGIVSGPLEQILGRDCKVNSKAVSGPLKPKLKRKPMENPCPPFAVSGSIPAHIAQQLERLK